MRKYLFLLGSLLLSACVGGAKNMSPVVIYDFGLPAEQRVAEGIWSRLAVEVSTPPWFDSLNIDYRLAYEDPLKPREYAGSRWAGVPGTLFARLLRQQLGAVSATGNTVVDCSLRVELQEFSQVFDSPKQSRGVVQGGVSLIDAKRRLIAKRQVFVEKPSTTADAHGGVNALVAASTEFGLQLAGWLTDLEKSSDLKGCRSARAAGSN